MTSNEQKLAKIFPESFQVKRLAKQIGDLKQLREKGIFEIRMSILRNQCLIFKVEITASAYKNLKVPDQMKLVQEYKVVVRNNYPANPPRLFFMNNNMEKYGLKPFRDYMPELLKTIGQWSAKITIQQLIKSVPNFLQQCYLNKSLLPSTKFPAIQQYFQIDNLFSWKFSQIHPIRLHGYKRTPNTTTSTTSSSKPGFMYIDIGGTEIVLLEDVGIEASYGICDYVRGAEVQALRKKKGTANTFLMEVKMGYPGINGKYGIEFSSQDSEGVLIAIMDCAKITENERKTSEGDIKDSSSSESEAQEPDQTDKKKVQNKKKRATPINENAQISTILQQILIYQSLVDNKMTSQNLSQLVTLLQKAIEYYSANSDERFQLYLNKMQAILSNQMAQALLESTNQEKKKEKKKMEEGGRGFRDEQYQSIVDLI